MSMSMLTFLQMTGVFCAYLLVTLGLPAFVLGRKLKPEHSLTERFLIYFMIGNFYVMNLVFILQLLKLSNFFTLIMGTLVPTAWAWVTLNRIPVKRIVKEWSVIMRRVSMGLMGRKTLILRIWMVVKSYLGRFGRMIGRFLFGRTIDTMFVILLFGALIWIYGINIFEYYGYKESDLLVHNYWINAMEENDIFVAGVYPYGFHCILYYLHAIFRFDNYVILRVFAFPQNIMIHLMLLSFLKLCCKSKYTAYIPLAVFGRKTHMCVIIPHCLRSMGCFLFCPRFILDLLILKQGPRSLRKKHVSPWHQKKRTGEKGGETYGNQTLFYTLGCLL